MSFKKRTSWRFPRLIIPQLLDELDAIPVWIEHVQEPDLVVELEHGSDLDVRGAQALGLRLHVVDVDRRDARLLRLTLGERDPHLAALELRPARLVVQVGLGEAELVRVEGARGGKIPDAVPDPHRLTLKGEAGFFEEHPDGAQELGGDRAVQRSMVAGQRQAHHRQHLEVALADDRLLLDRAYGEDRDLRRGWGGGEQAVPLPSQ